MSVKIEIIQARHEFFGQAIGLKIHQSSAALHPTSTPAPPLYIVSDLIINLYLGGICCLAFCLSLTHYPPLP